MKTYFLGLLCLITTLLFQYAVSWGLILISYFSFWIYTFGGFFLFLVVFFLQFNFLVELAIKPENLKYPKDIQHANEMTYATGSAVMMVLVGGFFLNIHFKNESEKYEFQHFGRQVKGVIIKKYRKVTGKGGKTPHLICSFFEDRKLKKVDFWVEKEDSLYVSKKAGDSIEFMYSTRNYYYFKIIK